MTNRLDDLEDLYKKFTDLQLRNEKLKKKIDSLENKVITGNIDNLPDFKTISVTPKLTEEDKRALEKYRDQILKSNKTTFTGISEKTGGYVDKLSEWFQDTPFNMYISTNFEKDFVSIDEINKGEGKKDNNYKLPMSKLFKQFPRALQALILASCYGHHKYKDTDEDWLNYKRVKGGSESYFDADIRHQLDKEIYGEGDESGLPHIFHELFDKMAKCELYIIENNIDIKEYSKNYLKNLQES